MRFASLYENDIHISQCTSAINGNQLATQ